MALLPRAALGRAKEKRHNWPQPLRSLQVVWPDREGWVPGHLPRWPQETKPCNRWSKDAGVRTSLLDTMLLFFTSFLKFLLILPLLKCLFFSPLFHCYIKYVLLIFFYKILELLSSFLFKVTPLWSFSLRSQERALLFCVQSPCASLHYWLSAPGGRVQEGGGRSVSPANLYLTDTAFRPPPPSVWPTAPGSKKPPDNCGNYLIAFLGPHKAPHAFSAASLSTRTPEWSCSQPPGHQRLGQACCPLICIGHLAPGMRR